MRQRNRGRRKKRGMSMEESKADTNKRSPDGLSQPNQNTVLTNITWYYFIRNGKGTMKFNYQKTKWT